MKCKFLEILECSKKSLTHCVISHNMEELNYTGLRFKIDAWAKHLLSTYSISTGDVVAVWGNNSINWLVNMYACAKIGAVVMALDVKAPIEDIELLLERHNPKLVIVSHEYENKVPNKYQHMVLERIGVIATSSQPVTNPSRSLSDIVNGITDDMPMCIQFTSGTTGKPKSIIHTYGEVFTVVEEMAKQYNYTSEDTVLLTVPLYHQMGCNLTAMVALYVGCTLVVMGKYTTKDAEQLMSLYDVTRLHAVPSIINILINKTKNSDIKFSHLKSIAIGGSIATLGMMKHYIESLHLERVFNVYGQTETFVIAVGNVTKDTEEEHVLTFLPYVQHKLTEEGELVIIQSPTVAKEYFNDIKSTKEVFQEDGIHTGDIVKIASNKLQIVSRCRDIINYGGEKFPCSELEDLVLRNVTGVKQAVVVPVPDDVMGESYALFINGNVSESQLNNVLKTRRPYPPADIIHTDVIPTTSSGKVQKNQLLKEYKSLHKKDNLN